jgi:AMP phosphorylase
MKLKVKLLKFSAGRPVVIINEKFAAKSSIHVDDRILLKSDGKSLITVVEVAKDFIKKGEIAVSTEVAEGLDLKKKSEVSFEIIPQPKSVQIIHNKLNCKTLSKEEIFTIIKDIVRNALTESEIAYFVSAVYKCGMNVEEVANMTEAIYRTGFKLGLKNKLIADKHSIGGIPGRTTPILVSICAVAGLIIPKTSSRAITTAAGTADAMEYLCDVDFDVDALKKIIKDNKACLAWGGSLGLAPADDKIIQVEKLLNLDPKSQLIASILAKKLAVGAHYLLIDVPYGKNAKVTKKEAENLAKEFIKISKKFGVKTQCILTKNEEPLGNGIGPALEIEDVIKILKGESDCHLLKKKSLLLSGKLLELTNKAKKGKQKKERAKI